MLQKLLKDRIRLMHTPKPRTCAYSGDRIEKSEIAVTVQPSLDSNNNEWIKLTSITPFIEDLQSIQNGDSFEIGHTDRLTCELGILQSGKATPREECLVCDSYTPDELSYKEMKNVYPHIISFTFRSDNDPWIHNYCVEELIDNLEEIFNFNPETNTEITTQLL